MSANPSAEHRWKGWIEESLARQVELPTIVGSLIRGGCSLTFIAEALHDHLPTRSYEFTPTTPSYQPSYKSTCDYRLIARPPLLSNATAKLTRLAASGLQIYSLQDFLTSDECDLLVELINSRLRPSTIARPASDRYFRTSRSCDLTAMEHPIVATVDEKIARTLGIRLAYSDAIEAQRYDVGQQFKPHRDYFEPNSESFSQYCAVEGNRTWTFMIYLNDGMQGGETDFPWVGLKITPKKGMAVIWNNLLEDGTPNAYSLHAGEPVLDGYKVVITKWFRERGLGPMFFEGD